MNTPPAKHWPLFTSLPNLAAQISPLALCNLPTPVEPLPGIANNAWVKRDDVSHPIYGGNKTRKFEFIATDIISSKAKHVITIGGTGTNHGVATAMICRELKLDCTVITFPQPPSAFVDKNQQLMKGFGARLVNTASLSNAALRFYLHPKRLSKTHYFLPGGGGTPLGALAYVNAALELSQQIAQGECPEPEEIYVPAGSVSTLAGLTLGCAIAGLKTRVIGIQVMDSNLGPIEICTASVGDKLVQQTLSLLRRYHPELTLSPPAVNLLTNWYLPGYGIQTKQTENAIALAAANGLLLDQTYSGKTFDAFTQALPQTKQAIMYWASYSSATIT